MADGLLMTALIAHIRPMHHSIVAIINTVHPAYGAGSNSLTGRLYAQNDKMPPIGMLLAVSTTDTIGNSGDLCSFACHLMASKCMGT